MGGFDPGRALGDADAGGDRQRGGAAANAGALLLFIATVLGSVVRGRRQAAKEAPDETS